MARRRWPWHRSARRLRRLGSGSAPGGTWLPAALDLAARHRTAAVVASGALAGAAGAVLGGPVASAIATGYAGAGVLGACRRWQARAEAAALAAALDAVTALAADLRAGLAPVSALAHALPLLETSTVEGVRQVATRVAAAWELAQLAGIPLAGLLDRLENDARALARVRALAAAQAAGARATAWLLAGLPLAGIGLGYGMGTDPVRVLLHTPLGAMCAGLAAAFQLAGLAWSARLARAVAEVC